MSRRERTINFIPSFIPESFVNFYVEEMPKIITALREEHRKRHAERFAAEHDLGPPETWDEVAHTLFRLQYPEVG